MNTRLTADIFAHSLIRLCETHGVQAFVIHKGYDRAGSLLIKKLGTSMTASLFARRYNINGDLEWYQRGDIFPVEKDADIIVKQAIETDPDLWVLEIEDIHNQLPPLTDNFWPIN